MRNCIIEESAIDWKVKLRIFLIVFCSFDMHGFAVAQNNARRHNTKAQMAISTSAVYKWQQVGANQHKTGCAVTAHPQKSNKELADIAGVSDATINVRVMSERAYSFKCKV